jgi:glutathione peroxidase-family protein
MDIRKLDLKTMPKMVEYAFKEYKNDKERKILTNVLITVADDFTHIGTKKEVKEFLSITLEKLASYLDRIDHIESKQYDIYEHLNSEEELEEHKEKIKSLYREFKKVLIEYTEVEI